MTIEKLLYLLTPPAATKIIQKLAPQKKSFFSNEPDATKNVEEELKSLRKLKFNYFMKDEIIEEFCDYMIISDNRGVHQGNVLYDGYRLQLGMVFSPLSNFDIGNIPKHATSMVRSSK